MILIFLCFAIDMSGLHRPCTYACGCIQHHLFGKFMHFWHEALISQKLILQEIRCIWDFFYPILKIHFQERKNMWKTLDYMNSSSAECLYFPFWSSQHWRCIGRRGMEGVECWCASPPPQYILKIMINVRRNLEFNLRRRSLIWEGVQCFLKDKSNLVC